ncbi:MAG: MFS transporter [Thaumarchaeota archaeon]|nr:MFS transporter [Nitrososphaerota archaeon]
MQYKYTVLTNTTIGAFMSLLDANIVLVSLPFIIHNLSGTSDFDGIWIIISYTLVTAVLLLTIGRLGDIFGRVKLYNVGFAIFTFGSGLCSVAPNGLDLVLFRLVQGTGAALIWSNNAAIITDAFPASERGRALGLNQVAGVSGSIVGLVAGGVLTAFLGWRSIFWINLPIGIFATSWAYLKLRDIRAPLKGEGIDIIGNSLFAGGLTLFLLGLTLGAIEGWGNIQLAEMVVGVGLLGVFAYAETRVKNPMMDINLFRIRAFMAGATANLLSSISRSSISLILVFYFQGILLYSVLTAGILLIPFSVAFVVFGPLSGFFSDRYGPRWFATTGMVLSGVALLIFSVLPYKVPYTTMAVAMVIAGAGGGMFVAPNVSALMSSVPPARRGIASGVSSTLFSVGSLLSLGLIFAIFAASIPLPALQAIFAGQVPPAGSLDISSFINSMHEIFLVMAAVSFICVIPASQTGTRPPKETIIYEKGV